MASRIKENHDLPGPAHDPWLEPVDEVPDYKGWFAVHCSTCDWHAGEGEHLNHDEALDLAAAHSDYYENLEPKQTT